CAFSNTGISRRQGGHQVAQMFTIVPLPSATLRKSISTALFGSRACVWLMPRVSFNSANMAGDCMPLCCGTRKAMLGISRPFCSAIVSTPVVAAHKPAPEATATNKGMRNGASLRKRHTSQRAAANTAPQASKPASRISITDKGALANEDQYFATNSKRAPTKETSTKLNNASAAGTRRWRPRIAATIHATITPANTINVCKDSAKGPTFKEDILVPLCLL